MNVILMFQSFIKDLLRSLISTKSSYSFLNFLGVLFFRIFYALLNSFRNVFSLNNFKKYLLLLLKEVFMLFCFPYAFFTYYFFKFFYFFFYIIIQLTFIIFLSFLEYFSLSYFYIVKKYWVNLDNWFFLKNNIWYFSSFDFLFVWFFFWFNIIFMDQYFYPFLVKKVIQLIDRSTNFIIFFIELIEKTYTNVMYILEDILYVYFYVYNAKRQKYFLKKYLKRIFSYLTALILKLLMRIFFYNIWFIKLMFLKIYSFFLKIIYLPLVKLILNLKYFLDFLKLNVQISLIIFIFKLFYRYIFKLYLHLLNLFFYNIKIFILFFFIFLLKVSAKMYFFIKFLCLYIYILFSTFFFYFLRLFIFFSEFSLLAQIKQRNWILSVLNFIKVYTLYFFTLNVFVWKFFLTIFSYDVILTKYTVFFYFQCKFYKLINYFLSLSLSYTFFYPILNYLHFLSTLILKYYSIIVKKLYKLLDKILW